MYLLLAFVVVFGAVLTVKQRVSRIGHVDACHVLNPVDFGRRAAGGLALDHRHVTDFDDTRGRTERNDRKAARRFFGCGGWNNGCRLMLIF